MPSLMLLPFAVFFACCVSQFWFLKKVQDVLLDRHCEAFLADGKLSVFPLWRAGEFVRRSEYKQLGDVELDRRVRDLKRVQTLAYVAWGAWMICVFNMPFEAPRLAVGMANGSYANDCCGAVVLKDGQMTVGEQRLGYVIESDKLGPYVLPEEYVGVSQTGIVIRRDRFPIKLRLDGEAEPAEIQLMDTSDGSVLSFARAQ